MTREVLADRTFGELYVGEPAAGPTHPAELLGLTATPERADGVDVRSFFDGRTAYELPLGDALDQDLLCPFHYFGIADNTDLTAIEWSRGAYDVAGLSGLYTGNDGRARLVLKALDRQVTDTSRMRALSGQTPLAERADAATALRNRDVKCLFTVDLFNEGVDLPDVDTLLLLRPTSSATVFLQQLGRGLRRTPGKAVLTVLDFIGQHRGEYRFDLRYRPLTGTSRSRLRQEIEHGSPFLPSGSQLALDRVAPRAGLRASPGPPDPRCRRDRGGRAAGDPAQGGARLLTHYPLPRLPAGGRPVPLGVPERHVPRFDHRPPLPRGRQPGAPVRARNAQRRPGLGAVPVLG